MDWMVFVPSFSDIFWILFSFCHLATTDEWVNHAKNENSSDQELKSLLVTGAAGFIGFSLVKHLVQFKKHSIHAFDNFNDYYDIKLKVDRAHQLHVLGVDVEFQDLCNASYMRHVILSRKVTHVVHLAAQAGIRFSLEKPLTYMRNNVYCFGELINLLSNFTHIKLVYASSSSVYGKLSALPFGHKSDVDHPGNMYAASKRIDELMAMQYCRLYRLNSIGLRFFTVYGPWGRPDMAIFKFTNRIVQGKSIPLFYDRTEGHLARDFTYIDDIVSGIIEFLDYESSQCGLVFNLGFGKAASLNEMVGILSQKIGSKKDVNIDLLPVPQSEMMRTWADISDTQMAINFQPKTNLTLGIHMFVEWYNEYHHPSSFLNSSLSSSWFVKNYQSSIAKGAAASPTLEKFLAL